MDVVALQEMIQNQIFVVMTCHNDFGHLAGIRDGANKALSKDSPPVEQDQSIVLI